MPALTAPLNILLDFALPPRCPGCGVIVADSDRMCTDCWKSLTFLAKPSCTSCDLPLPYDGGADVQCAACIADPPQHDGIKAAVAYDDLSRAIVLRLKHGGRIGLAPLVARLIARHLADLPRDALLVPVPLHWTRLWTRKYNQSALLAHHLGRLSANPVCVDLLKRTKRTRPLGGLSAKARAATVKQVFAVDPKRLALVEGRHILLVDDVHTSGATTDACTRVLKKAGAHKVTILCWARVLPQALETQPSVGGALDEYESLPHF